MSHLTRTYSLRTRLTIALTVLILAVFGSAAFVVDRQVDHAMQQRFDADLLMQADAIADLLENTAVGNRADTAEAATPATEGGWFQLRCDGRRLAHTMQLDLPPATGTAPRFAHAQLPNGTAVRVVSLPWSAGNAGDRCTLDYAAATAASHNLLRDIDLLLIGSLLVACALVVLATPWVAKRALRPLAVLSQVMADIGPDTPGARLPSSHIAELSSLTARFNEVLARMDDGMARERRFAAGVAHEFRTRLAELRVLVEVETRYPSGRDSAALLAEVGHICAELEATVTALLQLTRIQAGLEQARIEPVPLAAAVERVVARHQPAAQARGLALDVTLDADTTLEADPTLLEVVFDNLLGNAIEYAAERGRITVQARHDGWAVCNAAPLLQPADLPRLGQQFWRKSPAGSGHAGLGIALAGAAAKAMHMRLDFTLEAGQLCAALAWPMPTRNAGMNPLSGERGR
ncbi:MAG: HAMP domain-containing histidine kinase [Rhodanobacter sp.]|nr:MAG: HAMP domain-containing histidine kinase [Rhodanobacter sp.]TAM13779.1 MAG: HAMP domain-containing histidine kinase [Rhodanobacter sp.]TAM34497.1 MAG: HAMP domain-containing histidine kinase [Rhodanobacter sp.]